MVDAASSAAMQAAIWEIIYEQGPSYDLTGGNFHVTPQNASFQSAFNSVNSYLTHLGDYGANYQIDVLTNRAQQDFLVATIPEPQTWALLIGGLALMGLVARRRKAA